MPEEVVCGLEIHQQLDTKKLFCSCDSELTEDEGAILLRRLRPTQSELGEVDRAALAEAEKRMRFRYHAPSRVSCLVEADEEPPHDANEEAISAVLTISALLKAKVVDEIHFMRKIVIDGSNTTGFQRTALVAVDGHIEANGRRISVPTICLEEDAARKVEVKGGEVTYKLDRLGIPLVEIATGPDLRSPQEVKEVAQRLGSILRATRKVKRGIGTIREDLNISIPGGARVEVKGVQELRKLPLYVEKEIERQKMLLMVRNRLRSRGVGPVERKVIDCTPAFEHSKSKVIQAALGKGGGVFASPLHGFAGVLRSPDGGMWLGAELAQHARSKGVPGIFHSDELPGYGIERDTVDRLREMMGLGAEDAFVLCAEARSKAESVLDAVVQRANGAIDGVPEETRDPLPDGTTSYSRPLPGAARMYPETDVRPITIGPDFIERIHECLPELPEQTVQRFVEEYGIHEQVASQLVREGHEDLFEEIASSWGLGAVAARTFLNTYPELEREGIDPYAIPEDSIRRVFRSLHEGKIAKEGLPDLLRIVAKGKSPEEAIGELGVVTIGSDEAVK
ncbi:MAG: Glu-tRNA(Gln) amidotransferase subunit GatE, partial [Euryarchaeota archaeon]|nr:Glu-tRNA(Gln) amidotransferase subunit GatE [Euryarchaeota archaeon]